MGDLISRQQAIDAVDSETVSTNPEHFKSSEKFIKFMDDADIASFGKWQWANGFNTGLVASRIQLKKLPSAEPEQRWIPCSERQPDVNGWYVTTISGEICGQDRAFSGMSEFANGKWMSGDDVDETEMTIAWMPLPEAYQEGEKE